MVDTSDGCAERFCSVIGTRFSRTKGFVNCAISTISRKVRTANLGLLTVPVVCRAKSASNNRWLAKSPAAAVKVLQFHHNKYLFLYECINTHSRQKSCFFRKNKSNFICLGVRKIIWKVALSVKLYRRCYYVLIDIIRYAAIIDKFFSWMYFQGYNYWSAAAEGLAQRMAGRSSHAVYQPFAPE